MPYDSPEAADALFTLARLLWATGNDHAAVYFQEGRRLLEHTPEYSAAQKARRLESAALDFERRGLREAAASHSGFSGPVDCAHGLPPPGHRLQRR